MTLPGTYRLGEMLIVLLSKPGLSTLGIEGVIWVVVDQARQLLGQLKTGN